MATPIWALAAAICRSAAAMSGLLSRSSEGRPTGMAGGVAVRGEKGMEKSDAGFPTSIAMACSSWRAAPPHDLLGLGGFELGFGLEHVSPR